MRYASARQARRSSCWKLAMHLAWMCRDVLRDLQAIKPFYTLNCTTGSTSSKAFDVFVSSELAGYTDFNNA